MCTNLCNELGQSDVRPNLGDEPISMNEPSNEPPPDEAPDEAPNEQPDEHPDKPPCINSVFYFGTNPNVDFCLDVGTNLGFCCCNAAYLDTNIDDDLEFSENTDENLGIDRGADLVLVLALTRILVLTSMMILVSTLLLISLLIMVLTQVLEMTNTLKLSQKGIFKQHLIGVKQISGCFPLTMLSTVLLQDIVLTALNNVQ